MATYVSDNLGGPMIICFIHTTLVTDQVQAQVVLNTQRITYQDTST